MLIFSRNGRPFPKCKFCKEPMEYWILGLDDEDYAHDKCAAKDWINKMNNRLFNEDKLNKVRELLIEAVDGPRLDDGLNRDTGGLRYYPEKKFIYKKVWEMYNILAEKDD